MKESVYIDTTIPSYYFDERDSLRSFAEVTRKWLDDEAPKYDIAISDMVLREIVEGNYPTKSNLIDWAQQIEVLDYKPEIDDIIQFYIDHFIMPQTMTGDAVHLAYASYYNMDYILTWNCKHLANANKLKHIRIINGKLGLNTPDIVTPLQLIEEN